MADGSKVLSFPVALAVAAILSASMLAATTAAATEVVEQTASITMSDGIILEAELVLPADGGSGLPAILVRTPYGRIQHLEEARFWAQSGYAVLVQDVRGKWGSNGEYVPFLNEHADGMATIDWIVKQAWSNGDVGMWGSSYLAFCQLVVASTGHPALKSIMPISGWIHDEGQIKHGGANHIMLSIPWILHEESQTRRDIADVELDELFEFLPLIDTFASIGIESKIWNQDFDFSHLGNYSAGNIRIPAFHITGWNDFVYSSALAIYAQAIGGRAGAAQKLMIGPWAHDQFWTTYTEVGDEDFGPQSALGREKLMELSLEWFDITLRNQAAEISEWPHVKVFVMGANEWRDYEQWPPAEVSYQKLFIGSDTGANSLQGDGYLSKRAPTMKGHDVYRFDPMTPVPTYGGANFHFLVHLVGVKDQRDVEARDDVLVYTTPPLKNDTELLGPVAAVLYASTEGRDTDFTAKLVEVRPNGYARIIEGGIIRASYRDRTDERELLEPDTVYQLTVELGSTAIMIPKGHKLRLEISSSNFPKYDRNPNTGEDPLRARELKPVMQKVYHGGEYRSHVLLPVVERKALQAKEAKL